MKEPISIASFSSISSLGNSSRSVWNSYLNPNHFLATKDFGKFSAPVSAISDILNKEVEAFRDSDSKYKNLDRSVLLAMYVSRRALEKVSWDQSFGVNIGSSRGATELFEKYYDAFQSDPFGRTETLTSPTTTLGNIASWVAHDLQTKGPAISHSITCSTALHSLLNGVAWLRSGMAETFLVGGSEAPLTAFTVAQMKALKIYAKQEETKYPCRAFDFSKEKNTMVLGEGAVAICLEKGISKNSLALISGVGYATEKLKHNISISSDALCFQKSMRMALQDAKLESVDVIVMHAPGTIKGDLSEYKAIQSVFDAELPALTTNKWKIGHTLGASGVLSIELALLMLQYQQFIPVPFLEKNKDPKKINSVLINAVGFGGNAVSILLVK